MKRLAPTLLALMVLPFAIAQAQLEIEHAELVRNVGLNSYTEIHFMVHNTGSSKVTVNANRTRNNLPNADWTTAVCTPEGCQSINKDNGFPFTLEAGASGEVLFDVYVDTTIGARGDFQISIFVPPFGTPQTFDMSLTVNPSGSVKVETRPSLTKVVPNPAQGEATLSLGERFVGRDLEIVLTDVDGTPALRMENARTDGNGDVRLELSSLPTGVYTVRAVAENGLVTSTRLVHMP